jgi:hypothetical protein
MQAKNKQDVALRRRNGRFLGQVAAKEQMVASCRDETTEHDLLRQQTLTHPALQAGSTLSRNAVEGLKGARRTL